MISILNNLAPPVKPTMIKVLNLLISANNQGQTSLRLYLNPNSRGTIVSRLNRVGFNAKIAPQLVVELQGLKYNTTIEWQRLSDEVQSYADTQQTTQSSVLPPGTTILELPAKVEPR